MDNILLWFFMVALVIVLFIIFLKINSYLNRCKKCGQSSTLEKIDKKFIRKRYKKYSDVFYRESDYSGNYKSDVKCYKILYKTYQITEQCSNCGHIKKYNKEYEISRKRTICIGRLLLRIATLGLLGMS